MFRPYAYSRCRTAGSSSGSSVSSTTSFSPNANTPNEEIPSELPPLSSWSSQPFFASLSPREQLQFIEDYQKKREQRFKPIVSLPEPNPQQEQEAPPCLMKPISFRPPQR